MRFTFFSAPGTTKYDVYHMGYRDTRVLYEKIKYSSCGTQYLPVCRSTTRVIIFAQRRFAPIDCVPRQVPRYSITRRIYIPVILKRYWSLVRGPPTPRGVEAAHPNNVEKARPLQAS